MSKTYILYYEFKSTAGNHAGMAHLVKQLDENYDFEAIKHVNQEFTGGRYLAFIYSFFITFYLLITAKKNDKIIFFEYLTKDIAYQDIIAKMLRFFGMKTKMFGLIHLSGRHLLELYGNERSINSRIRYLDGVFTLGSSLSDFLIQSGVSKPVHTTFHYVDTHFYSPSPELRLKNSIEVVCMGGLKRDFSMLKEIILRSQNVTFHICMGNKDLRSIFGDLNNVILYPFLKEIELLKLMQKCNVGLSVLEDTVGSNVITTSLAVGLVQVVSNVGSISDYLDTSNSFLCNDIDDFVNSFSSLEDDTVLTDMSSNALNRSRELSVENFARDINEFLNK